MRTADVVRHLQIIRSEVSIYPVPIAYESLAVLEAWVLEGARLSDVMGVDPRIRGWIADHPERPAEVPSADLVNEVNRKARAVADAMRLRGDLR